MNKWKVIFSLLLVLALGAPALAGYGDYHESYGGSSDEDYDGSNEEPNYGSTGGGGKEPNKVPVAPGSPNTTTVAPIDSTTGGNIESSTIGADIGSIPNPGSSPANSTSVVAAANITISVRSK